MSLTAYGIEQLLNGPDPAEACGDWNVMKISDASGVVATLSPTISRTTGEIQWYDDTWTNGDTGVTLTEIAIFDAAGSKCKSDAVDIDVEANQGASLTVKMSLQ